MKRRLRASVQARLGALRGCQAIIAANVSAAGKDYAALDSQVAKLFARAGLLS